MRRTLLALSVVVALSAACSRRTAPMPTAGDAGSSGASVVVPVGPDPSAVRLCEALHRVPAERVAECCGGSSAGRSMTDDCVKLLSTSLAQGSIRIAPASIDACVAASRSSLENCAWVTPSLPPPPAACKGIIEGRLAESARCRSHLECKPGLHCDLNGICSAAEPIGSVCGRGVDTLASLTRQYDVETAHRTCAEHCSLVAHKCEPVPVVGTRCFANVGCASGQLCIEGACAVATAGQDGEACAGTTCAVGLRCDKGKCRPKAAPGELCANDFECAIGGCTSSSAEGPRKCGTTCSHAADLPAILKKLAAAAPAKH
jgi:hypothetical protein